MKILQKLHKKWWKIITISIGLILIFGTTGLAYQNKAVSFHFVDEEDNFVLGKYLIQGEKLYQDLFSHHQPLAYIMSAGVQSASTPESIFTLLKRHREGVIGWGFLWAILIVATFGLPYLLLFLIYESSKLYLLGNLFLSESLAVYPLIFLVLTMLYRKPVERYHAVLIGFASAILVFLLAPAWPIAAFILAIIFFTQKNKTKFMIYFSLGSLPILLLCAWFSPLKDYFHYSWYINFRYYIPSDQTSPQNNIWKSFLTPVFGVIQYARSPSGLIIALISLGLIINLGVLLVKRNYKLAAIIVVLLGLANIRYIEPGSQYYAGFHLIPWFGVISTCLLFLVQKNSQLVTKSWGRFLLPLICLPILGTVLFYANISLLPAANIERDYYVNYSRQFTIGEAIRIMKTPGDTLFVAPDEWLVYWQADIPHATKMINYYQWMTTVPELHAYVEDMFMNNPPTFFYCDCTDLGLEPHFAQYTQMQQNGNKISLYVRPDKFVKLTTQQKSDLQFHNFSAL